MFTVLRIFPSEQKAREAAGLLAEEGFGNVAVFTPEGVAGAEEQAVRSAVRDGRLAGSHSGVCIRSLQRGRSLVAVPTRFGQGRAAIDILESCGAVETESIPSEIPRNPSPFSDFFGIPVLSKFSPSTDLSIIEYTFGRPRSIRNPAPFSSLLGLKTLTASKRGKGTSLLPQLIRNAAPFSSLFGLKTLSRSTSKSQSSFGLPLLSRNPTPLSSLFGLRVLSKKEKHDRE